MKTTINVISVFVFSFCMFGCNPAVAQCSPYPGGWGVHGCSYGGWKGGAYYNVPPSYAEHLSREHFFGNRNPYRGQSVQQDYQYRQGYYGSQTYRAWNGW